MRAFDGATPVEDILAYVDRVRAAPARREGLVGLLPEQAPIYAGRSASEAERIRGYLLASFETTGLPPAAIDYVLEELESGLNPYAVAAAAKAMRGAHAVPEQAIPLLLRAIDRIRLADDFVCFDRSTNGDTLTTALMELFRTLAWLGPRASTARAALEAMIEADAATFSVRIRPEIEKALDAVSRLDSPAARSCCASQASSRPAELTGPAHSPLSEVDIRDVELQDQNGAVLSFGEFFHGRPGIMTFFYTRCMNPEKCSLAITKLARLQRRICEQQLRGRVNMAAITYDPAFDLPRRLHAYGTDRGMTFDERNRMLRTMGPFDPFLRSFDLGVGYGSVTVNRHRRELFVLNDKGRAAATFPRMLWQEEEVFDALKTLLARQ